MNGAGARKAAIDVGHGLVGKVASFDRAPPNWEDTLKPAKVRLMKFAERALRHRSDLNRDMLKELVDLDTSDWRQRAIRIRYKGGLGIRTGRMWT